MEIPVMHKDDEFSLFLSLNEVIDEKYSQKLSLSTLLLFLQENNVVALKFQD